MTSEAHFLDSSYPDGDAVLKALELVGGGRLVREASNCGGTFEGPSCFWSACSQSLLSSTTHRPCQGALKPPGNCEPTETPGCCSFLLDVIIRKR